MIERRWRRIGMLFWLLASLMLILGGRLAYLQLVRGRGLAVAAVDQRTVRLQLGNFCRGDVLDRNGRSLLASETSYTVALFPQRSQQNRVAPVLLGQYGVGTALFNLLPVGVRTARIATDLEKACNGGQPLLLTCELSGQEAQSIAEAKLAGVYLVPLPERYGVGALARHLVGCVSGMILHGEKERGIKGLEALYDRYLAPVDSRLELLTVVDRMGNQLRGEQLRLRGTDGIVPKGNDLVLTIDHRVQQQVEQVLDQRRVRGAVVVLDRASGEVRALASRPEYDQRSGAGDQFDRTLALYHPGSVFKIVVAAAALSEHLVKPEEQFLCPGGYTFDSGEKIRCWKQGGHGLLTFEDGFANSCNTVFVTVAQRLGWSKIEEYARQLGVESGFVGGQLSGYHGGSVQVGHYPGQIGNAALGQEGVMMTPVNVAVLTGTIAREGVYLPPAVVKEIRDHAGKVVQSFPSVTGKQVLSVTVAREIQQMMELTVRQGTGKRAAVSGLDCAGKTGSAETGHFDAKGAPLADAWFTGYTGKNNSGYVITVFIEDGGAGGGLPAEIFHDISSGLQ